MSRRPEDPVSLSLQGVDVSRFWFNVEPGRTDDECWEWNGEVARVGYGRFSAGERREYAHRLSYELEVGPIPAGMEIHHRCENPVCINPAHLMAASRREHKQEHLAPRCPHGHDYDGWDFTNGCRRCLTCHRDSERRRLRAA